MMVVKFKETSPDDAVPRVPEVHGTDDFEMILKFRAISPSTVMTPFLLSRRSRNDSISQF